MTRNDERTSDVSNDGVITSAGCAMFLGGRVAAVLLFAGFVVMDLRDTAPFHLARYPGEVVLSLFVLELFIGMADLLGYAAAMHLIFRGRRPASPARACSFAVAVGLVTSPIWPAVIVGLSLLSMSLFQVERSVLLVISAFLTSGLGVAGFSAIAGSIAKRTGWLASRGKGECWGCGYDLRGSPAGGDCPECGAKRA
ncbi:MAG: hypothetical protein NTW19_01865 [Planctomycetota bacterium]|nr:hypothetical protein [Planctomycetota bacterium]